ncbi:UDP-4-amino-4,6-dideoxy-N-acetyl-beta-L-altrosamine transaminase [Thiocystis violacea]|uniref:UDP-4-amino-4, 6-dideoxy-N-acetyl-beta-L-altrosamine transaminase n=1 Tax=Thiocystis violacea TaxID=13725 RepID=UPI0019080096|nr:UDP-4-amino-4,6-dideoxy-N-acetyl-beta-L-altrosamine transaminase [Thiocystis violacea]MBK1719496.1 UDP-4-amino-4,6-dideoxy-N-acetyl-beta-L-altrosamine transaminase [Thiocystis violacea]
MIPYGWHDIDESDIAAVVEVLRHGPLTQGTTVERFEQAMAADCQSQYAVACNSASSGLLLACRALELGPGDWLWTSPITFAASATCALHCGARVDLVDVDPATGNLSPTALACKLAEAQSLGRLPRILVPVHYAGRPCDMAAIGELAQHFGFAIIEDAAHALGASDHGQPVGACRYSQATVFSFHPVKQITTGEGGMVLTNDAELAARMARLRTHDIRRTEGWHYSIEEPGYNFRLTDIQAALGLSQLKRLPDFVARRRCLARRYHQRLSGWPLMTPHGSDDDSSAWHLYVIRLGDQGERRMVYEAMRAAEIGVQVHYIPLYRQPFMQAQGMTFDPKAFPGAESFYASALTLPLYPGLTHVDQESVLEALRTALSALHPATPC